MNNRNITLDIAKGIGIILIVLGHNIYILLNHREIYRIIYSFHIPLFLFISGIFLNDIDDQMKKFIRARADALWKPFIVVILFLGILRAFTFGTTDYAVNAAAGVILFSQMFYSTLNGYITFEWVPLWYMTHLFVALVISKISLRITKGLKHRENWILALAILFLVVGIWFANTSLLTNPRPPFTSDVLLISIAIILMGFLLKERVLSMIFNLPLFLASILVFSLLHYFFNDTIDLAYRIYSDPIISTLQAILGIYITLSVSILLKQYAVFRRPLTYIGSGSVFIMMFHNFAQVKIYLALLNLGYGEQLGSAISFVAGVTLPLVFWEIVKRQRFLSALFLPNKSREKSL